MVAIFLIARSSSDSSSSAKATSSDAGSSNSSSGTSSATPTTKQKATTWPQPISLAPALFSEGGYQGGYATSDPAAGVPSKPGVYFWESYDGWHVRVVPGEGVDIRSVVVSVPAGIRFKGVTGAVGPDAAHVEANQVSFDASTSGTSGFDFNVDFYAKEVTLTANGPDGPAPPAAVLLGKTAAPTLSNPITFKKSR